MGDPATATRIVESFHCGGTLENTALAFLYDLVQMSSGDLFATASIVDVSISTSATEYYSASQVGYATAQVVVIRDEDTVANGGYFTIKLNRSTLVTTISYFQDGIVGTPVTDSWTMQPSDCTHNFY